MTAVLAPNAKQQFFDNNGRPLVGGKLFSYDAGTTTKRSTYVNAAGITPNSNPIILDYRGECNLWVPANVGYKYVLAPSTDTDPPTHAIWTVDNIKSSQLITLYGGVDTGVANAYVLTFVANFDAYADGIVIFWIPANTNSGASTINVNGLGPVALVNGDGSALSASEIQSGLPAIIIYSSGKFILTNPAFPSLFSSGSFTATVTGCTTAPTKTVTWAKSGKIIVLNVPATGVLTSNATSFGMSGLPVGLQVDIAAANATVGGIGCTNNGGAFEYAAGDVFITPGSGNLNFEYKGGLWAAANTKSFSQFVIVYFNSSVFG